MQVQRISKWVRWATALVLILVLMAVALNATGLLDSQGSTSAKIDQAIRLVPTAFFVVAIWTVSRAAGAIERGHDVEQSLTRLMWRLGLCLLAGGISFVFLQPILFMALTDRWTGYVWFDVPAITLGALGLLLVLLAGTVSRAAEAQHELEGFV